MVAFRLPLPGKDVKTYHQVFEKADLDKDGHVTKAELEQYQQTYKQGLAGTNAATGDSFVGVLDAEGEVIQKMLDNFRRFAYRGLAEGEMTTMDWRSTDETIEAIEIDRVAGFDGNPLEISAEDLAGKRQSPPVCWPPEMPPRPRRRGMFQDPSQLILMLLKMLLSNFLGNNQRRFQSFGSGF